MAIRPKQNGVRLAKRRAPGPGHSPPEVAQILGLSEAMIRTMIAAGELRAVKVGKRFRVPPSAVAELKTALT